MTTKEAIRELEHMKQYATAKSIPALDLFTLQLFLQCLDGKV